MHLTLTQLGDTLTINGEPYDFSGIPEGATLPREAVNCPSLASDVARQNGELELTLILPHGANPPAETLFPAPVIVTQDGSVAVPPYDAP